MAPTQRRNVQVLRELRAKDEQSLGGFGWGYDGSGSSRAAAAILADALDLGDPRRRASPYRLAAGQHPAPSP
ncbi:hypothetical protein HET69_14250 [Streptomyces sp. CJ_13]|uniref:DUF6166 domain-containing protein n=1 Tax=Streptomyces sp. CJ_13 TaxID=2724943 RepID=UPI001BDC198D|nr:DUF6166 domain-containing protein [Streptomyces sp. CJ_13]MBT1185142.1 hypothetical protein [Streptomyces sp. CJ_13]